jgi:lysylphosphatidylglycerol synthetase-like protein (DUF2156 family)
MEYIKQPKFLTLILFGIILGLQVNSHSLGALLSIIEIAVLFLFAQGNFFQKVKFAVIAVLIVILAGGVHYLLDVATGTGWIFQDLKFY